MPVYIGKSGDLVGWHRCLTDWLTDRQQKIVLLSFSTVSSLSWVTQLRRPTLVYLDVRGVEILSTVQFQTASITTLFAMIMARQEFQYCSSVAVQEYPKQNLLWTRTFYEPFRTNSRKVTLWLVLFFSPCTLNLWAKERPINMRQ